MRTIKPSIPIVVISIEYLNAINSHKRKKNKCRDKYDKERDRERLMKKRIIFREEKEKEKKRYKREGVERKGETSREMSKRNCRFNFS